MTDPRIVSADDLCAGAETVLRQGLMPLVALLDQHTPGLVDRFKPIETWQQLPVQSAIVGAQFPAVGISSPGLSGRPQDSRSSGWSATWRILVGIYDRGADHHDTAAKVRDWASFVRAVMTANRSLGGIADGLTWVTEEYALYPQQQSARTFAAAAVGFDVHVSNVIDLAAIDPQVLRAQPSLTITP